MCGYNNLYAWSCFLVAMCGYYSSLLYVLFCVTEETIILKGRRDSYFEDRCFGSLSFFQDAARAQARGYFRHTIQFSQTKSNENRISCPSNYNKKDIILKCMRVSV